jgi:hypothetical protein
MGQYGNQPDFGTRAVAITPKGFAGGSYVNVSYQDSEDKTQNIYLTNTNLNVSTLNDGSLIPKANNVSDWEDYTDNQNVPCWAYYGFEDENEKYGKVYNIFAVQNANLYSPGYSLLDYSVAGLMTNANGYNPTLGQQLKSIPTGQKEQDLTGTTLWAWEDNVPNGTNVFGFTGLPGGYYSFDDGKWYAQWQELRIWDNKGDGEFYNLLWKNNNLVLNNTNSLNGYYVRLQVDPKADYYVAPQPLNSAALYVGTGGDLVVTIVGSETPVMFKNVPDASFLPIIVSNVWERGDMGLTTASDIIAIY